MKDINLGVSHILGVSWCKELIPLSLLQQCMSACLAVSYLSESSQRAKRYVTSGVRPVRHWPTRTYLVVSSVAGARDRRDMGKWETYL